MGKIKKYEEIDEMYETAQGIINDLGCIPDDVTLETSMALDFDALGDYLSNRTNYCILDGLDKNELEYRMFIWPVYDEYTALIMRVHKDDTVDLWNVETGEWDSSRDATEIYDHELKNDTTWEILEQIAYMANDCPYFMEHEDIARIEKKK